MKWISSDRFWGHKVNVHKIQKCLREGREKRIEKKNTSISIDYSTLNHPSSSITLLLVDVKSVILVEKWVRKIDNKVNSGKRYGFHHSNIHRSRVKKEKKRDGGSILKREELITYQGGLSSKIYRYIIMMKKIKGPFQPPSILLRHDKLRVCVSIRFQSPPVSLKHASQASRIKRH